MKVAILSDIHDNQPRLMEAIQIAKDNKTSLCVCCGDLSSIETVRVLAEGFKTVYLALGNMDFALERQLKLLPENVIASRDILELKIGELKIAAVHHEYRAKELAKSQKYDVVFYGHTHTPWEKIIGQTTIINPGEVAGQFGRASFAIFDTKNRRATLKLLK